MTAELVVGQPDQQDRQAVVLRWTEKGREVLRLWLSVNERGLQAALSRLVGCDSPPILAVVPALIRLIESLEAEGHDRLADAE